MLKKTNVIQKSPESLKPTQPVTSFNDPYLKQAISDLLQALENKQAEMDQINPALFGGVGLAANQIDYPYMPISDSNPTSQKGFYPKDFKVPDIYVVSIREGRAKLQNCDPVQPTVYINAKIEPADETINLYEEACLSVMGFQGLLVPRYEKIRVSAYNIAGEKEEFVASGFIARVHQHEVDHGKGEEYLNRLKFSTEELRIILDWIIRHENGSKLEVGEKGLIIIPDKFKCTSATPEFAALKTWTVDALNKKKLIRRNSQEFFPETETNINAVPAPLPPSSTR